MSDAEVDVVYVASPHHLHRDDALLAIAAGVDPVGCVSHQDVAAHGQPATNDVRRTAPPLIVSP